MVQALVSLGKHEDRVLTIIKGKYGLKTKSEAINFVIEKFEEELLEPQLKPVYAKKLLSLEKNGKFKKHSLKSLRNSIENA